MKKIFCVKGNHYLKGKKHKLHNHISQQYRIIFFCVCRQWIKFCDTSNGRESIAASRRFISLNFRIRFKGNIRSNYIEFVYLLDNRGTIRSAIFKLDYIDT